MLSSHIVRNCLNKQIIRTLSSSSAGGGSKKLWGGRFGLDTDERVLDWVDSTPIDTNFAVEDIWGSMAHVSMLGHQEVIPFDDAAKILGGLLKTQNDFQSGDWVLDIKREDVHMNVEGRLIDLLGMEVAGKMHTTRSRNDQVCIFCVFCSFD